MPHTCTAALARLRLAASALDGSTRALSTSSSDISSVGTRWEEQDAAGCHTEAATLRHARVPTHLYYHAYHYSAAQATYRL